MTGEHRKVVLICDDDQFTRMLVRAAVEAAGMDAEEAMNGAHALAMVAEVRPDVIVLDLMMPGMDGVSGCSRLREHPDAQDTPILVVSGTLDEDQVDRAYAAGATDFMAKPIDWPRFSAKLLSLTDKPSDD